MKRWTLGSTPVLVALIWFALHWLTVLWLAVVVSSLAFADEPTAGAATLDETIVVGGIEFSFASVKEGRKLLSVQDEFVDRMSPFDRQLRMQSKTDQGIDAFLEFAGGEVRPWEEKLKQHAIEALESLKDPLSDYAFRNLTQVNLIYTTGREEAGAAYTRGNSIVFQKSARKQIGPSLMAHELFHVVTRHDAKLRDTLYKSIGFLPAGMDIQLPESLVKLRMTNPDAPLCQHVMKVQTSKDNDAWITPVLYANQTFDPDSGLPFFGYLEFHLMEVVPVAVQEGKKWFAASKDDESVMHLPSLPSFHRQIGRNTGYIFHPEEILADNFALLLTDGKIKDPWVTDQMKSALKSNQ